MSARLLRKVLEEQQKQQLDPEAAIDDRPDSPVSVAPYRNPFDLLDDDGGGSEERDEPEADGKGSSVKQEEQSFPNVMNFPHTVSSSSNKSKKKKKKKKDHPVSASVETNEQKEVDAILENLSLTSKNQKLREVVKLKNMEDQPCTSRQNIKKMSNVLSVDPKFLKAENELKKIFGSKVVNSFENSQSGGSSRQMSGGRRAHNLRRQILISPISYWPKWDGLLSMELLETKSGINYFRYVYPQTYIHIQQLFEVAKASHDLNAIASILAHYPYHIEALLTFAEVFKFSGEHQSSADAVGKCLFALECAWHPLFNPIQGNCQLKYIHDTNKPIFIALVSHMKNMDRRGCHRSALEVCKLLLSLDSDDPVGSLFFIDYFSIRAQEYAWLEQFSEEYRSDNSIWLFPNFSYSLAISRFYLERDSADKEIDRTDRATSSDLMKQALMLHPLVVKKLVAKAPLKDPAWTQILKNPFFCSPKAGGPTLDHLIDIYVERNYIIWRYPELQNFLKDSALHVIELMKQSSTEAKNWTCVRKMAFSSETNEYAHLLVSDFSDTVPSLPPEELRQFMVGPHAAHEVVDANRHPTAREVREVVGRNPAVVFLESLLPWIDYGANGDDHQNGQNPNNAN